MSIPFLVANNNVSTGVTDTGSMYQITNGTYTHTFTSNCTVYLTELDGAGGGASDGYGSAGLAGNGTASTISIGGTLRESCAGGRGAVGSPTATPGTDGAVLVNNFSSTATTGGALNGGLSDDGYTNGGNGALATGGSYAATSGQVLSVVVGKGGVHSGASYNADGLDGIVDLTWG